MRFKGIPSGRCRHYVLSFLIQIVLAGFFLHPWDGFVFLTSAQEFLQGVTPYEIAQQGNPSTSTFGMECWYAYPPLPVLLFSSTFAPYFHILGGSLILERIFLKLSFILGNLLCAYLVYRVVAGVSSQERASKAEKVILYNPFLIFIAAVWGMFDVWMVNFLLLGIIRLRHGKIARAGVYLGLSILVKPLAGIFLPILLVYVWNRSRKLAKVATLGIGAAGIFCLVSLPFFLIEPKGFLDQVVGIHAGRPPGGVSPFTLLYVGNVVGDLRAYDFFHLPLSAISGMSMALLVVAILFLLLYLYFRRETLEADLFASLFVVMLFFTLFNKLVNPQYFVTPIVLAVVILFTYREYSLVRFGDVRRYYKFLVVPLFLSQIIEGRHYLLFIPPDIALRVMGQTSSQLDIQFITRFPVSPDFYYAIHQVSFVLLIIPVSLVAIIISYRALRLIVPTMASHIVRLMPDMKILMERRSLEHVVSICLVVIFVLTPVLGSAISYARDQEEVNSPPDPLGNKLVGAFYYYWWHNSSRNPERQYDNWSETNLKPSDGYYNLNVTYIENDIRQMKDAGIDFAAVSLHNAFSERYLLFTDVCEQEGFYFVPVVELYDIDVDIPTVGETISFDEDMKDKMIKRVSVALDQKDSPCYLHLEGRPAILIHNSPYFPSDSGIPYDAEFWTEVRAEIVDEYGEVFWVIDLGRSEAVIPDGFDSAFFLPSLTWIDEGHEYALEEWENRMETLSDQVSGAFIATVMPYYDDRKFYSLGQEIPAEIGGESTYDLLWEIAMADIPDIVLIYSWNEYFEGCCIEPTQRFGNRFLDSTKLWTDLYKSGEA